MTKYTNGGDYGQRWAKNVRTGAVFIEGERVTIGRSKNVWDIVGILGDGMVRLHRQIPGARRRNVLYRLENIDRLTTSPAADPAPASATAGLSSYLLQLR